MLKRLFLTCFALILIPYVSLVDFSDPVDSILDSETTAVLNAHHTEGVPLNGIDCPEKGLACKPL